MAKGTDSEPFVLLSGVRTGLKREFAFALKVQSELSGSLGRTRSRKFENSPSSEGVSENSRNKRLKSSHAKKGVKDAEVKSSIIEEAKRDLVASLLEEPKSDLVKSAGEEEAENNSVQPIGIEESNGDLLKPESEEEPESNSVQPIGTEESNGESGNKPESNPEQSVGTGEPNGDNVKPLTEEERNCNPVQSVGIEEPNSDLVKPAIEEESENNLVQSVEAEGPGNDLMRQVGEEETKNDWAEYVESEKLAKPATEEEPENNLILSVEADRPANDLMKHAGEEETKNDRLKSVESEKLVKPATEEEPGNNLIQSIETERPDSNLMKHAREEETKNNWLESVESEKLVKPTGEVETKKDWVQSIETEKPTNEVALKVQSEMSDSIGTTRARTFQNDSSSTGVSMYSRNKRFKSSHAKKDLENNEVMSSTNGGLKSELKSLCEDEPKSDLAKPTNEKEPKNNCVQFVGTEGSNGNMVVHAGKDHNSPNSDLVKCVEPEESNNNEAKSQAEKDPEGDIMKSQTEESTVKEAQMVVHDNSEVETPLPARPPRRFTRSALTEELKNNLLKAVVKEEPIEILSPVSKEPRCDPGRPRTEGTSSGIPMVIDDVSEGQNASQENLPKRFTRSALKIPKAEPIEVSASTSGDSVVSEDSKNAAIAKGSSVVSDDAKSEALAKCDSKKDDVVSPLKTPPKKKLELKMSKKIALTKFPSRVKELLETGLLEGLPVQYVYRSRKQGGLRGTIKDCGILCTCTSCKGCKVVTPFYFEQHAGSTNKRPSQYIYLENGNSLRDVLEACKGAALDELEAVIKSAIGLSTMNDSTTCETSPACTTGTTSRSPNPAFTPRSSNSSLKSVSVPKSKGRLTRKDLRLHKLVFEEGGLPDGTEVGYYAHGKKLLEGYKKGFGIFCRCCNTEVSASQFEAHAGWASRRKPYLNIYTSNGVSLHELSLSLSKGRKFSASESDDLCTICADGGDLLLCDGCPRAFHKACLSLSSVPRGDWYCKYCQNMFEREKFVEYNANARAAGRVPGIDPIEQITKRCIRIINTPETEVGGCVLCRGHGFTKSGFGPRTVLLCDQCEKEYHVGCLREHNMADLKELPEGKWFCCTDCSRIHSALQKLLHRGSEKLPDSLSNIIKKKQEEKGSNNDADLDVRWRLLSGKNASPETKLLLSKAVAIFHDRFDPIVDSTTGRDLIPSMVYG
nr:TPA_asm: hypothetical protein HUJ06_030084 [Nelumbo nucifera]